MTEPPRVALVAGAARGSGAATVTALAAGGWRVMAVDRCADDPALPYPLGRRAELAKVAADAGPEVAIAEADTRDVTACEDQRRTPGRLRSGPPVPAVALGFVPALRRTLLRHACG